MAKNDKNNSRLNTISAAHFNATTTKSAPTLVQQGRNAGYPTVPAAKRILHHLTRNNQHVRFESNPTVATCQGEESPVLVTYDSGADGNYLSAANRK